MKTQLSSLLLRRGARGLVVGALLALPMGIAFAEDAPPAQDPMPAEIMPKAPESLLLDITRAGEKLFVVGERGHVLVSPDGKSFEQKPTPVRATLNAVDFVGADKGWAVGHDAAIIATTDGGETWTLQYWGPELEKPLLDVAFLDDQRGFAVGAYGLFLRTSNGGVSWETVENEVTLDEWHFTGIARLNDGALLISGEAGGMAMSRDDGDSWVQLESPYEGSYFGVLPWGEAGALLFGLRGNVYMTNALPALDAVEEVEGAAADADMEMPTAEWQRIETGTVQSFMGGSALPTGGAVLVGVNGVVLTLDPAGNATLIKNPVTLGYSAVISMGGKDILVAGEGGTYPYTY